jgi:hypothetical protein
VGVQKSIFEKAFEDPTREWRFFYEQWSGVELIDGGMLCMSNTDPHGLTIIKQGKAERRAEKGRKGQVK